MGHNHHEHGAHSHQHPPKVNYNLVFALGIGLNLSFVFIEGLYGYWAHSMALLADAGHNLSDVLGLILAWGASWLSQRKPSPKYTYGFRSLSIFAALGNALILLVTVGGIIWEAIQRFNNPAPVASSTIIVVAGIGMIINAITAISFMSGRKSDLNIKGAYLHMAADALVSAGVVVAGIVIAFTGWEILDPLVSMAIGGVILISTWGLLKESINLSIAAVPAGIMHKAVFHFLKTLNGVQGVHDLHIWGLSTTETALTVHLVIPTGHPGDTFLLETAKALKEKFGIHHSTVQIELNDTTVQCELLSDDTV